MGIELVLKGKHLQPEGIILRREFLELKYQSFLLLRDGLFKCGICMFLLDGLLESLYHAEQFENQRGTFRADVAVNSPLIELLFDVQ